MGPNKPEKRIKKIKKRGHEIDNNGKSEGPAKLRELDNKHGETEMKENDVAAGEVKAHKSKKLRKIKKKVAHRSEEQISVVHSEEESEPVAADHSKRKKKNSNKVLKRKKKDTGVAGGHTVVVSNEEVIDPLIYAFTNGQKDKSNKVLIRRKKDTVIPGVQSTVVSTEEETEPMTQNYSDGKKDKSKRAHKNKKNDAPNSNKLNTLNTDGEEVQPNARVLSKKNKGKPKKARKQGRDGDSSISEGNLLQKNQQTDDVYQIASGEDDDSKGMKKWIKEYHEKRPGLKVLQERIDDFITSYDEREEQAKREREALMDDDGWTVVVHRKGGKKTTDSESGVAVGSVAEAAVREKMAKKKNKDVGLDFYRFQRKEAHRSEIMKLQSKFEEDKRRIQQIRAARKFKPY